MVLNVFKTLFCHKKLQQNGLIIYFVLGNPSKSSIQVCMHIDNGVSHAQGFGSFWVLFIVCVSLCYSQPFGVVRSRNATQDKKKCWNFFGKAMLISGENYSQNCQNPENVVPMGAIHVTHGQINFRQNTWHSSLIYFLRSWQAGLWGVSAVGWCTQLHIKRTREKLPLLSV